VRLNTERAPDWNLELHPGHRWEIGHADRNLTSGTCVGVWWRRPEVPSDDQGPPHEAIAEQWRAFLIGLASVPGPVWVSDPAAIRAAEGKAKQLKYAGQVGLRVPDTLWTNDVAEAHAFMERWEGTAVVKSVANAWWEEDGRGKFVFARRLTAPELPSAARLASAPVCFQQAIWPKRDIRVTVIDDTVLAAVRTAIPERDNDHVDWRLAGQGEWAPYDLPNSVGKRCRQLARDLDLRFSGIDFAVDDSGRHWFLELNANGEWGWLQRAGLPIAEALADLLESAAGEKHALMPARVRSLLLTEPAWRLLPTPATWYLNRERLREPRTMPALPPAGWTRIERWALLAGSEGRLRNLEGKGTGLATISTVVTAAVVAAITTGWSESQFWGRLILASAAIYVFLSLLVPLYLVGPLKRSVIDVNDLVEASTTSAPEETLAERAAEAAMTTDLENLRVSNLLDAARRELAYVVVLLIAWLLLVPATGWLKHVHDATRRASTAVPASKDPP
jgi:glutathione synthase/RimK-type ligase-like ATP-grasp enzyme